MKSRLQLLVVLLFIGIAGFVFVFSGKNDEKDSGLMVVEDISSRDGESLEEVLPTGGERYSPNEPSVTKEAEPTGNALENDRRPGMDKTSDLKKETAGKEALTKNDNKLTNGQSVEDKANLKSERIFVHVCGAVLKEGVYELPSDARVVDAIRAAGGLKKKAASAGINQAELLKDGVQVYVPTKAEFAKTSNTANKSLVPLGVGAVGSGSLSHGTDSGGGQEGLVNINLATKEELMKLKGVGEAKAELIITYREAKGGFKNITDLMKIKGIKQKFFDKIKDKICI